MVKQEKLRVVETESDPALRRVMRIVPDLLKLKNVKIPLVLTHFLERNGNAEEVSRLHKNN